MGNSGRRCRRQHWRGSRPARFAPRPYLRRRPHPAPPPEWHCAAPRGASRPGGSAGKPWRVFRPWAHPDTDGEPVKNTPVFSVLGEFFSTRFKELNTYSGWLTRCIATVFARHGGMARQPDECRSVRFASNLDVVDGCDQAILPEHARHVRIVREPLAPIIREVVDQKHGGLVVLDVRDQHRALAPHIGPAPRSDAGGHG